MLGILLLNLALTAFAYMAFPVVRLIINGGKFEAQRAKKLALWNSIVVGAVFLIAATDSGGTWSGGAAILYYYINRALLTDKKSPAKIRQVNTTNDENLQMTMNLSSVSEDDKLKPNGDVYEPTLLRLQGKEEEARQLEAQYESARAIAAAAWKEHTASHRTQEQDKYKLPLGARIGIVAIIAGVATIVIALVALLS